ncbi:hypothetical protein HRE53_22535 [Acaryochloris sp. 'Moss Beach']|uniref:hypothetical protein n=1 Tax=Acaryochloris sp. 'Moss Beach' TaxID=2740837 RepID=UPI001F272448|nr:hypothetical protein [Acaryochloris sp. 'Moss Beach']UJB69142.1 hypothetical protein HRE53_22535 [Acaryochloris sp. 'Moss Beach']
MFLSKGGHVFLVVYFQTVVNHHLRSAAVEMAVFDDDHICVQPIDVLNDVA